MGKLKGVAMQVQVTGKSSVCARCGGTVVPMLRFYRREPDAFICPECKTPLYRFSNEARRQDRLLVSTLAVASFLMLLGFLFH